MSNYFGGAGNDILGGSGNDDLMIGYGGEDVFKGSAGQDLLYGGDDRDNLKGGSDNDTLHGDAGDDQLNGQSGQDVIFGGAGNDLLIGFKDADFLDGGEGDDTYRVTTKDEGSVDTYSDSGTGGYDVIDATRVVELMLEGDFSGTGSGIEEILGSDDKVSIVSDGHAVNWDFTGIDLVNVKQIVGSGEDDVITGSAGNNKIKGGAGNDLLKGANGNDNLAGGGGDDVLDGGTAGDKLLGGSGADVLYGGEGNDTLQGGEGNDFLDGGEGGDTYVYKDGETLNGDAIADTGGDGTDVLDVSRLEVAELGATFGADNGIEMILGNVDARTDLVGGGEAVDWDFSTVELVDINRISGSAYGDSVIGSGGADKLNGLDGDDVLGGGDGEDTLTGGSGDDTLSGGAGNDVLKGSGGDDLLHGGAGDDKLKGGAGNDTLKYDADDSQVDGQAGEDTLALVLSTGVTLDITASAGEVYRDIEIIDLAGNGNTLVLDKASVKAIADDDSDVLVVRGGAGDFVLSSFEWNQGDDVEGYHVFTSGNVILKVQIGVDVSGVNTEGDDFSYLYANTGVNVNESTTVTLTPAMLTGIDADVGPEVVTFTLTDLPDYGLLQLDGTALELGDTFTQADLDAGMVTYASTSDDGTQDHDSFGFDLGGGPGNDTVADTFEILINATLEGTEAGETLAGGDGHDFIDGLGGDDTLLDGGGGDDVINGGTGNDFIRGGAGDDHLLGDAGDDVLRGGPDDDIIDGGAGNDRVTYFDAVSGVTVNLGLQGQYQDTGGEGVDKLIDIESLSGGVHNDTFFGDGADNFLWGSGGDDHLEGGAGDDLFWGDGFGTLGDDWVDGGDGTDTMSYEDNNNEQRTEGVEVRLYEGTGGTVGGGENDMLVDIENVIGTQYGDILYGDGGANVLDGFAGDDILLYGGAGDDIILGGDGHDLALVGGQGSDTLHGGAGNDFLFGSSGIPHLYTDTGGDALYGGAGDDYLNGGVGDDWLDGGDGQDRAAYYGAGSGVTVNLGIQGTAQDTGAAGMDTLVDIEDLSGTAHADTLTGDDGDNWLWGIGGSDILDGGAGNDELWADGQYYGIYANDTLDGGDGIDTVNYWDNGTRLEGVDVNLDQGTGGSKAGGETDMLVNIENVIGTQHDDTLFGSEHDNRLDGAEGNDFLQGDVGDDHLLGGAGNDILRGGSGNDLLEGGDGVDRVSYYGGGPVTVNLELQGQAQDTGGEGVDTLTGIESLSGGIHNDTFFGDDNANWLWGSGGDDHLYGGGGNDLFWGDGSATLGSDTVDGGDGIDTLSYEDNGQRTTGVYVDLEYGYGGEWTGGMMLMIASGENDMLSNIENVEGTGYGDYIAGDDGANTLWGGGGNDALHGRGGDDVLNGGEGNDALYGGTGEDTFVFATTLGGSNIDEIQDFYGAGVADGDVIQLDASVFTMLVSGSLLAADFSSVTDPNSAAVGAQIIYESDTGKLYYDADGDGNVSTGGVQFATLTGNPAIDQDDFIIVGVPPA